MACTKTSKIWINSFITSRLSNLYNSVQRYNSTFSIFQTASSCFGLYYDYWVTLYLIISVSRRSSYAWKPRASRKGSFCIFPSIFTVACHKQRPLCLCFSLVRSLFHFCFSLFLPKRHRESFTSCAPTVWKLNERLQLCSLPLQPATLPTRLGLFILQIYYWHYITRNCQTCRP